MIKNDSPVFGRLMTAMVTPFGDDGKIDFKAVERIVDHLQATGTETILVSGTTGESPTLSDSEKISLLKAVLASRKKSTRVIMGTGSNSTAKSIEATAAAEKLGIDGILAVAPYYNKPSQEGLLAHFEAIAGSTSRPVIVYNIPGRTGINITAGTTIELARRCPNIYALKDSTGSTDQAAEIAGNAREDFRVFSGDDYLTLPLLAIGACGVVSVASHVAGLQIQSMIDLFLTGNLDQARQMHYRYLPLFKGLFAAPNPTCIKYALSLLGLCKPNLRLPLVNLSADQQKALKSIMTELKIGTRVPVTSVE